MFTTPNRAYGGRSATPNAGSNTLPRSGSRYSRAGTPLLTSQDPVSPPSFRSPVAARGMDDVGDVSSGSAMLNGASRSRTPRSRPRPGSMLSRPAVNTSRLSPGIPFDREDSVFSENLDVRSVADSQYGRRTPAPTVKDSSGHLEEGAVLLGDQWINVSAFSRLPTEVLDELGGADLYIDAYQGHLDVQTGYAYLVARTKCFVWNYSSRAGTSPTCFVFSVPEYASSSMTAVNDLAHCSFVPRGSSREPALLLITPDGQSCLWEGISSSLTRQDRAQRTYIPLSSPTETVTKLQRIDDSTMAVATSHSRMFRVSLGSRSGSLQAEIRPFSQPRGIFGRLFGSAATSLSASEGITSIAKGPSEISRQGREVVAIGKKVVQLWQVLDQGGERLIAEQDVQQVLASSILQQKEQRYSAAQSLAFEVLDGAIQSNGKLILLYSETKSEHEPLHYGFAVMDVVKDAGSFAVAAILPIQHTRYADPRPYAAPTLSLPGGGPAAFITFADTVIAKQLDGECHSFEELVVLKDDASNRFVGVGSDSVDVVQGNSVAALSLISAASGSLLVEMSIPEIRKRCKAEASSIDRQRAETERLKGKLEQALYYSESPHNPLSFQLPSRFEGTLMTACEQLSREILTSINPISRTVPFSVDLRSTLKDRVSKLRFLVKFVSSCGHLEKLPQSTKRQLRADAELASAVHELWIYQNESYSQSSSTGRALKSPLARAIEAVVAERDLGVEEDVVRSFFRYHADITAYALDRLLPQIPSPSAQSLSVRSEELVELSRVALVAFRAALRFRKENGSLYGIKADTPPTVKSWTARAGIVSLLGDLFSATANLIVERSRELGSSIDIVHTEHGRGEDVKREQRIQTELKSQLSTLSEISLASYDERYQYLKAAAYSDLAAEQALTLFESTYRSFRPSFIRPLVSIGRSDRAFALAEQYRDFRTLVELCNDSHLRSEARIETYLDRYKEPFAFELYAWFIEQGKPRTLLEQKAEYAKYVSEYLTLSGNVRIGWIHDLTLRRFDEASTKLEKLAFQEANLLQRKTMLSISKLSFLSNLTPQDIQTVGTQKQIEFFDDQLDLVAVQNSLLAYWENAIGGLPIDIPDLHSDAATELAQDIVDTVALRLTEYPAYRAHYIDLVKRLLIGGQYLGSEDLIDLLTLKDTPDNQLEDFATAIKVLVRAKDAPQHRLDAALRAIWRRAIVRDDWLSLSDTNNVSDQTILADLHGTALYAVLREVLGDESNAASYLALQDLLSETATDPTAVTDLLTARFQDSSAGLGIDALVADEDKEIATVAAFMEDTDLPRLSTELAAKAAKEASGERDADASLAFNRHQHSVAFDDDDDNSMADD